MLRYVMGDSLFFKAMRNYLYNEHLRYKNAVTDDFMHECENVYGKSLVWFFNEWIYASSDSIDRPEYRYGWSSIQSNNSYRTTLEIEQATAQKLLYRMPIPLTISTKTSTHEFQIVDSLAVQSFVFETSEMPTGIDIDKENHVFKVLKKKEGF
jgi:aminopeptidase N